MFLVGPILGSRAARCSTVRVSGLMDAGVAATDPFGTERGRLMMDEQLPKRVRVRKTD